MPAISTQLANVLDNEIGSNVLSQAKIPTRQVFKMMLAVLKHKSPVQKFRTYLREAKNGDVKSIKVDYSVPYSLIVLSTFIMLTI